MRKSAANNSKQPEDDKDFMSLVDAIVAGNVTRAMDIINATPSLVQQAAVVGASREAASDYFYPEIRHYIYTGDTALHMAAAAFRFDIAQILIDRGARYAARNRRGAEPLHYASDCNVWNPTPQVATIECLIRAGANPNSLDMSGVAPIHRAVRTRSGPAVQALLSCGAKPDLPNKSGSTPLHLAVQNTGRSGSGTPEAIDQQKQIISLLLQHGATTKARDGGGKTVDQVVNVRWVRELLDTLAT